MRSGKRPFTGKIHKKNVEPYSDFIFILHQTSQYISIKLKLTTKKSENKQLLQLRNWFSASLKAQIGSTLCCQDCITTVTGVTEWGWLGVTVRGSEFSHWSIQAGRMHEPEGGSEWHGKLKNKEILKSPTLPERKET